MKILFDQGTPAPLRHALIGHEVVTAHELNWSRLVNGELLRAAEPLFDQLITTDQSIGYQQNLSGRRLAILVLPTTNWLVIQRHLEMIAAAASEMRPGEYRVLEFPP